MMPHVLHAYAMAVLECIAQDHSAEKEEGGAEMTDICGIEGKGGDLKGV